jgi:hypothetical protein
MMILQFLLICELKLNKAYRWRLMISDDDDSSNICHKNKMSLKLSLHDGRKRN